MNKEKLNSLFINIENNFKKQFTEIKNIEDVKHLEIKYLGKKGFINQLMIDLKTIALLHKKELGQKINLLKKNIIDDLKNMKQKLQQKQIDANQQKGKIDVSLPSFNLPYGVIHPLQQVIEQIEDIFLSLGYQIHDGLEVEKEFYNFDMMNMGKDHPAREMQDSFYIDDQTLLRTHTSAVQVKSMLASDQKTLKIISSGKVFRRDKDDMKHSHQFTQLEGFIIDQKVTMIDLKQHISFFLEAFFQKKQQIRFRPSYFPFTEPSIEVDLLVINKDDQPYYLEVLGAGLIHPQVIKNGGYDPKKYQGFAFGMGIERLAMLKYQIEDVRSFYNNDIRFLKQFV